MVTVKELAVTVDKHAITHIALYEGAHTATTISHDFHCLDLGISGQMFGESSSEFSRVDICR